MTTIVVLFNLKRDGDVADYEAWAKTVDIPNVRRLDGCSSFNVLRVQGLLNGSPDTPYQYVELIEITDMDTFKSSVSTEAAQQVAAQFREFADAPVFMVSESIE